MCCGAVGFFHDQRGPVGAGLNLMLRFARPAGIGCSVLALASCATLVLKLRTLLTCRGCWPVLAGASFFNGKSRLIQDTKDWTPTQTE